MSDDMDMNNDLNLGNEEDVDLGEGGIGDEDTESLDEAIEDEEDEVDMDSYDDTE